MNKSYLEGISPLGFWDFRKTQSLQMEIRVYPDLLSEMKNLSALFLPRGSLGIHSQRQIGKGREFEKLREYMPGDSFEDIHWKTTAKRARPVTKVYQLERTQEVYVIIDASRLSARTEEITLTDKQTGNTVNASRTILERYITAAMILWLAAEQQGDLFGVLTFSDKVLNFIRAKNGKAHYSICRDKIYSLNPEIVTPDYNELFSFIRLKLRRRALLVFLTSLDDPVLADEFTKNIDLISQRHLVVVNMIKPRDTGQLFTDPNVNLVDDLYRKLGGHMIWSDLRELEKVLQRLGISFSQLNSEVMCKELLSRYISIKKRQLI